MTIEGLRNRRLDPPGESLMQKPQPRIKLSKRLGFGLLRLFSNDFRAYTDLFDNDYEQLADWRSGLEEGNHLLFSMVRLLRPSVVVEIGSARGKSSCSMALACRRNGKGKVYAIDPHIKNPWTEYGTGGDNESFLRSRLRSYSLEYWCEVIRDTSANALKRWDRPIDLLFIDGDHSYEGVKADFEGFRNWLTKDALVVFHDTTWDYEIWARVKTEMDWEEDMGVPRYMAELRQSGFRSVTFPAFPGITVLDPKEGGFEFPAPARAPANGQVATLTDRA
jgi:predicted O-methyltransferase YrrM